MKLNNQEEEVDLDANVVDTIPKELHIENEEEDENDVNRSFKEAKNNTNDKHRANEGKGYLKSVSTHLELISFRQIRVLQKSKFQQIGINNNLKRK